MYSENRSRDVVLFVRASMTNLLARFPLYVRLGNRSGRAAVNQPPRDVADYFRRCVDDYCAELGVDRSFFAGKRVLEYGPGDCLGVALVLYAYGAASVHCVDQFPIYRATPHAAAVYREILDALDGDARAPAPSAGSSSREIRRVALRRRRFSITCGRTASRAGAASTTSCSRARC